MVGLLIRIFIKNYNNVNDKEVRTKYGILCGFIGIFFNLCLSIFKFFAGIISGSVAICADAINNLSDALSSIITLIGFKLSNQKADSDHPFGHGRYEYISGLYVSVIILIMAFELFKTSFEKILKPHTLEFSPVIVVILLISILVKLYMAFYSKRISKKINSSAINATTMDSLSDVLTTSVVLISTLVSHYTGLVVDAYCGLFVSIIILYAGIGAMRDTINPLLGQAPSKEFVEKVTNIVMSHENIIGIHDLIVHNYGPLNCSLSLHAEVPANLDLVSVHNIIDHIEHDIRYECNCSAVIHMDPVMTDDAETNCLKERITAIIKSYNQDFSLHDFRIMHLKEAPKIMFDLVVPYNVKEDELKIKEQISEKIFALIPDSVLDIEIDRI